MKSVFTLSLTMSFITSSTNSLSCWNMSFNIFYEMPDMPGEELFLSLLIWSSSTPIGIFVSFAVLKSSFHFSLFAVS